MTDILVENGTIVTMDSKRRVLKESSVAIANGMITGIGPAEQMRTKHPQAAKIIDARRKVIMPGLFDLHGHAASGLLKDIGEENQFIHSTGAEKPEGFLHWREFLNSVVHHVPPEWYYVESLLVALEKLKAGTICSLYMLGTEPRGDNPEYAFKNAEAVEKVGIRSIVGVGPSRPPWPRKYTYWENGKKVERIGTMEDAFKTTAETIQMWEARKSKKVEMWVSISRFLNPNPADPVYDPDNAQYLRPQAEGVRRIMDDLGVGFHVHCYGTTIKWLQEEGFDDLLRPRTVLAHCWPLDLESVAIIAAKNAAVAHCPRARRCYMMEGRCPVPEMIDAGVTVGLGSDAPVLDRSFDLWEDMFFAPRWQRKLVGNGELLPPGKILEMATIDGARAVGLDDKTGSIEVGKEADMILVDYFKPHLVPIFKEVNRLVHFVRGPDVDTVIVQGEILMENRTVKTVDETDVLEKAQYEAEKMVKDFGLESMTKSTGISWGQSERREL